MEHDNTVPEAISRRRAIAAMLGIPPVLLGLASAENRSVSTTSHISWQRKTGIDAATLKQYQDILRLYWELDYTSTAQESLDDIMRWIRHLNMLAKNAPGEQYRVALVELICRYHQLATWITRDQCDYNTAFYYANRAIKLAKALNNSELLAAALFRRGRTLLEQGNTTEAITDLNAALPYVQRSRPQLKSLVLLAAGHAQTHAEGLSATDISQALTLIDQAGRLVRNGHLEDDESFVKLNIGRFHQDRAGALILVGKPAQALEELDQASSGVDVDQTRRHAYIDVLRAQAYANEGEISLAIATAKQALTISQALRSNINIARIQKLSDQLSEGKYKDLPQLAHLRFMLTRRT